MTSPVSGTPRPSVPPVVVGALLGIAGAVLGLLPWLVSGMPLPLQNLWAVDTMPADMPLALLPFNQYLVSQLAAVLVVGGAVAGLAARPLSARLGGRGFLAVPAGLLLVQAVAVVQTAAVVGGGLQERRESSLYLGLLVALSIFAVLVGVAALWLIARAPRAGALVGLGIGALMLAPWLQAPAAFGTLATDAGMIVYTLGRWVPAVLVGVAIAWAGIGTVGRAVAAFTVLLALWLVPALIIGVTSAAGTRILARDPAGMLEYGFGVFRLAATSPALVLGPVVAAIAVAALGLVVRSLRVTALPRSQATGEPGLEPAEELGPRP
ncbi:MAG TPA: hypothetical protein VK046_01685 [Actinomycetaceae bacterium]|nr:hypothetical protein [Actinomycetaceae bacterium]